MEYSLAYLFHVNKMFKKNHLKQPALIIEPKPDLYFGIDRNVYQTEEYKVKRGDTFGKILEENGIDYPQVYAILQAIKGKVDVRKLTIGKPYTLFY